MRKLRSSRFRKEAKRTRRKNRKPRVEKELTRRTRL